MKYHNHTIKKITPSACNDLICPIYEIYDENGKLVGVEVTLDAAKAFINTGEPQW